MLVLLASVFLKCHGDNSDLKDLLYCTEIIHNSDLELGST